MKHTIARYTVRADRLAEHEALLAGLFAALEREAPAGLAYRTARLDDGRSFVHHAEAEDFAALSAFPAFRAFRATLEARCDGPLAISPATLVGSYGAPVGVAGA